MSKKSLSKNKARGTKKDPTFTNPRDYKSGMGEPTSNEPASVPDPSQWMNGGLTKYLNGGQESDWSAAGTGALSGAATGASIGTAILPGYGTAIGGVAGGLIGGVAGY